MNSGVALCTLWIICACSAEKWQWPEEAASVRIDTKVRFIDGDKGKTSVISNVQADEVPFREPTETEGFYNRPPGAGRYPVRVEQNVNRNGDGQSRPNHYRKSKGNYDTLHCKCVSEPLCQPRPESETACGYGKYLCCYKQPQNTEYFNEVEDERPMMLPGRESLAQPFPPPDTLAPSGYFGPMHLGHSVETLHVGPFDANKGILVGPDGPTGIIGPTTKPDVLVGPGGPTGIIGPAQNKPEQIRQSETAQRGVLIGPSGPTGIIGPYDLRRPVLIGPGSPTGIIGPGRRGRGPGVLVGPGGPTGIIGPAGYGFRRDRYRGNGVLTGPGGPTGVIGPGRQILVGPEGPTGQIGPQAYYS